MQESSPSSSPPNTRPSGTGRAERGARPNARGTILALAIDVLDRQGEVAIRVNHLADQAGVTPPTLYRHFGSRDGLVAAAQAARYARTLHSTTNTAAFHLALCRTREEVRACVGALFASYATEEGAQRRRERLNVLGGAYARPVLQQAIAEAQRGADAGVVALVELLQARGLAEASVDARTFAAWLTGMLLGRSLVELQGADADSDAWNRMATDAVCAVLFGA